MQYDGVSWSGLFWLRTGTGDCECSNEPYNNNNNIY